MRDELLAEVAFPKHRDVDPGRVALAVFRIPERQPSAGEVAGIRRVLPEELRTLWP